MAAVFDDHSVQRIQRVVRDAERGYQNDSFRPGTPNGIANIQHVRVTSTTTTAGRYPGRIQVYSSSAHTWTDLNAAQDCWVIGPNSETLKVQKYSNARMNGEYASLPVFLAGDAVSLPGGLASSSCSAYANAAAVSLTSGAYDAIALANEYHDDAAYHDTVTNNERLTPPVFSTKYRLSALVNIAANATGIRKAKIVDSGGGIWAEEKCFAPHATEEWSVTLVTPIAVPVSGYFTLNLYQNSGAPLNIGHCIFSIESTGS